MQEASAIIADKTSHQTGNAAHMLGSLGSLIYIWLFDALIVSLYKLLYRHNKK